MRFVAVVLASLISLAASKANRDDANAMPLTLSGASPTPYPVWVDQRAVLNPDGSVNTTVLHPAYARGVDELLKMEPRDGCVQAPSVEIGRVDLQPRGSIQQATETAQAVILSRVTGRSFGFYGGEAGQLLRVAPEKVFKGGTGSKVFYTFIPVGEFQLGQRKICKSDARYPDPPEIGAEIITFTHPPDASILDLNDPGDIIVIDTNGKVSLPENYSPKRTQSQGISAAARDRAGLLHQIGENLGQQGPR